MADRMQLDGIHPNHITASFYDPNGFAATVQIGFDDLKQLLNALPAEHQDAVIADVEKRRAKEAVAELLADRRADREERANRRREMRQDMANSYAR